MSYARGSALFSLLVLFTTLAHAVGVTAYSQGTSSPIQIIGNASSSSYPISGWAIYVDSNLVFRQNTSLTKITTSVNFASGSHNVVVRAWDTSGAFGSAYLTVTPQVTSTSGGTISTTSGSVPCQAFSLSVNNYYNPWPSVSPCSKRLWDTGAIWKNINPSYGYYYWNWLDTLMAQASQHGADVAFTFGVVPAFASTNPSLTGCAYANGACAAPHLSDWSAFVDALSRHSAQNKAAGRGHIGAYELWNEPDAGNWWRGTTSQMLAMAQVAYRIIHANDPTAIVVSPAPQGIYGWKWTAGYLAIGGGNYADVIGMHGYLPRGTSQPEYYLNFLLTNTKAAMAKYGVSWKPIWDMEASWTANSYLPSDYQQMAFLSRSYILRLFNGVRRFYWYSWDNTLYGTLWSSSRGIHPAGVAYGQVSKWLVGAALGSCSVSSSVWTCNISRGGGYVGLLVWNQTGSSWYHPSTTYKRYRDLYGGTHTITGSFTITQLPVLLEN